MKRTVALILVVITALALVCLALAGPALTDEASPSPSPSPTVTPPPLPTPASAATIALATGWKHRAQKARHALIRVRGCFGSRHPVRVAAAPKRAADEATWAKARKRWRHQARDWRAKVKAGRQKMLQPGGNGAARWAPLMRWTGWSEYGISVMVPIVQRESSGSPHEPNHQGSGCYGLFQLAPCWWPEGAAWIYSAEHQCLRAWHIFHVIQHDSQYPAWAL